MSNELLPNILILMSDQHRADCMSCAGHPQIKTPNMDRLAEKGWLFNQAYTVSPVCMPARASFINGRYPHNHGMWHNSGRMPDKQETFLHSLQKAGYYTSYIGKAHFYPNEKGHTKDEEIYMKSRGFDYVHEVPGPWGSVIKQESPYSDMLRKQGLWESFYQDYENRKNVKSPSLYAAVSPIPTEYYLDSYIGNHGAEFIKTLDSGTPSCVFISFGGPHEPHDPPGKYASMYRPEHAPEPIRVPKGGNDLPLDDVLNMRVHDYGKITLIDDLIGNILAAYEKRGLLDNLLIVYISDHGEMAGDHGRMGKQCFYDASVRVPLIISCPDRFTIGKSSRALVESIDIYPTIIEIIGHEASNQCQGKSLLPLLSGNREHHRDKILSEVATSLNGSRQRTYMIMNDQYKYAVDEKGNGFLMIDRKNDPEEKNNLTGNPEWKETEKEMRDILLRTILNTQTGVTETNGVFSDAIL